MILIQHADATQRHLDRVRNACEGRYEVLWAQDFDTDRIREAEILFTYGKGMTVETFQRMPKLKWVQLSATGFDHMPKKYILDQGIWMTSVKGSHVEPIAEYAFSCMLYFTRRMDEFIQLQKQSRWDRTCFPSELSGKTLVILGTGHIGSEIARKAEVFSMKTVGLNRRGTAAPFFQETFPLDKLETVVGQADYLILALPLTEQTDQLIGDTELGWLKREAVVINLGRGELMEEEAARRALEAGRIRGLALDVFHQEPLPKESPLWGTPRLLLTPHMAAKTDRFLDRCLDIFLENYQRYIMGEKLRNLADYQQGY
ncbi:D-2-hydroxyacid dehydrogenase [Ammoniphilus sp. CFH 90114]|uniref:D-2-hydroxyacid dehydrogenase n=1 Tax=Ammoniphilus sp. CFH 90114 TaxID=2493665 RepID=UPI00100F1DDB|nr:D-2-hydroxyacid dehydrogenase [Ammoniphilus sp. CFH 90114]RXT02372.1 D-2-hydroxyacid dehydrogenase [Ammoniphilus sp. CFH 90114]